MIESAPNIPGLYELIALDGTDSCRAHAERLATEGADEGTLVWSRSQQMGLGRKGNYWMSGSRNLHCAVILRPEDSLEICCQLSLLATISAALAIARQAEPLGVFRYRWPNDITLNQGKIAGVTLSGVIEESLVTWMVVGLNVNVYDHPSSKGYEAASMRGEGFQSYNRVTLLEDYSRELLSWINRWSDEGFEPIRRAWSFKGYEKNEPVTVKAWDTTLWGGFESLEPDGSMRILSGDKQQVITLQDFYQADFQVSS